MIFWVALIVIIIGLISKFKKAKYAPENLPQLFISWKKKSLIHMLKVLSTWAFFLYTFSPIILQILDLIMDYELGYIDYIEDLLYVEINSYSDFIPIISAIETYFLNVGVSGAIMNFLKEASIKDLSSYLKKTPIASELIRTSGDTFMLNPSIAFAHTCNVFKDVRRAHTTKLIIAPICSFITAMCVSSFIDAVITFSYEQSRYPSSSEEMIESIFTTPAFIIGLICLILPIIISISLSRKANKRMYEARTHICAPRATHSSPSPSPTPAPAPTAAPTRRTYYNDDGDVSKAFGGFNSNS